LGVTIASRDELYLYPLAVDGVVGVDGCDIEGGNIGREEGERRE
jgi:hypothetical protein